jgi:D-arabinose 1-dehydrogenase-like Zn-dependent alcohol dehydrogenase
MASVRFGCSQLDGRFLDVVSIASLPHGNRSGEKVAVVGLGGLSHLAVKLAAAGMGAEVTLLFQSLKRQEDGLAWGQAPTSRPVTLEPSTSSPVIFT